MIYKIVFLALLYETERGEQRDREKPTKMKLRRQKSITRYYSLRQKSRNNFLLDPKFGELKNSITVKISRELMDSWEDAKKRTKGNPS